MLPTFYVSPFVLCPEDAFCNVKGDWLTFTDQNFVNHLLKKTASDVQHLLLNLCV